LFVTRSEKTPAWPWNVPVALEDVPETGQHVELVADEVVRAAVARLAGVRQVPRLVAVFDVSRHGSGGLRVTGSVSATVEQTCVVTLAPVVNEVEEDVDLTFVPGAAASARPDAEAKPREEAEPLIGGQVDLGAVATEFLILGLDPYPRRPGAVFEPPQAAAADDAGPFAALAKLKHGREPGNG
jgi:hypothetical protein